MMTHLTPLPLTVLSGITVVEKELPLNELPAPVTEIVSHLKKVITADATFTYKYDIHDIPFNNENLKFNEYGDSAFFKDKFNNVYNFDFIENGMDYFLHSINVSSDVILNEDTIKSTLQHLGFNTDLLHHPSLGIVFYFNLRDQGILIDIHPNVNMEDTLKTFKNVKNSLMCRTFKEMLHLSYGDSNCVSFSIGEVDFIFFCYIEKIRQKLWVD
ncbi:unnamed protein product [Mytilus edulis]|uniref:Uncharacterized protein n=1 Tax=Mytilus edulis TaxID=6550 RepID=A0A8S3RLZ8_MYTED|nr:unnamed protein product [Mytilus edulis]